MEYNSISSVWDPPNDRTYWMVRHGDISSHSGSSNPSSPPFETQITNRSSMRGTMIESRVISSNENSSHLTNTADKGSSDIDQGLDVSKANYDASTNQKQPTSTSHLRRRAANRASQRAFRERKEKHLKALEHQLEDLHEKHQDLMQSYVKQSDEVNRLTSRISELTSQLRILRSSQEFSACTSTSSTEFEAFDAYLPTDTNYYGFSSTSYNPEMDVQQRLAFDSFDDTL